MKSSEGTVHASNSKGLESDPIRRLADELANKLRLYVVTDRTWLGERCLAEQVDEVLRAGGSFLQLREKEMSSAEMMPLAAQLKSVAAKYQVPFIINDDFSVALAVDADGVHIGQSDGDVVNTRHQIGPNKLLGVSVQTVEQAIKAEDEGADYLGVGAIFPTGSKADADAVALDTLKAICEAVRIPVVAIGGIGLTNMDRLKGSGICGVAVISAIFAEADISTATSKLKLKAMEVFG